MNSSLNGRSQSTQQPMITLCTSYGEFHISSLRSELRRASGVYICLALLGSIAGTTYGPLNLQGIMSKLRARSNSWALIPPTNPKKKAKVTYTLRPIMEQTASLLRWLLSYIQELNTFPYTTVLQHHYLLGPECPCLHEEREAERLLWLLSY